MRTALLAAVKRTDTGELRAELELGGRSVLAWQVELVRALGCERIICLCEAPGGQVLTLQKRVEAEGGAFHAIRSNIQLATLVRADDELVMLLDGLIADRATAIAHVDFEKRTDGALRRSIATIPADHPLAKEYPEDFERIDRDRHWAGFAVMRASHVHTIADLPPDSEPMSLLLRLGLQGRVEGQPIPPDALDNGRWTLAVDDDAIVERELALVEVSAGSAHWGGPGKALAATLIRKAAPRWLGNGFEISALSAVALMLGAVTLAGLGMGPWGLGLAALGSFAASLSDAWGSLRAALWSENHGRRMQQLLALASDVVAVTTLVLTNWLNEPGVAQIALPFVAIGLARHLGGGAGGGLTAFWSDRPIHLVIFAIAAGMGFLDEALAVFALGALAQLLLRERRN
ncbi:MAG: hypothetical protein ACX930_02095 [Erythrobacter sp.]